ncbi:hypothetical protein [Flavobacterium sp. GCM10023249]|uniref:hypothetical protein n=1 Tax=unclassified Flavobacterium TaxID=196869 RepID=UPI00360DB121
MKKSHFIIVLLFGLSVQSQDFKIPDFQFIMNIDQVNPYIELLGLKDKNSLCIKAGNVNSPYYLAFQNDGKVFKAFTDMDKKGELRLNIEEIKSKKKKIVYYKYLEDLFLMDKLNIDKKELNITKKPLGNGKVQIITCSHCSPDVFEIIKGNKTTFFGLEMTDKYIEEEYPGIEDKKKFASLLKDFYILIEN